MNVYLKKMILFFLFFITLFLLNSDTIIKNNVYKSIMDFVYLHFKINNDNFQNSMFPSFVATANTILLDKIERWFSSKKIRQEINFLFSKDILQLSGNSSRVFEVVLEAFNVKSWLALKSDRVFLDKSIIVKMKYPKGISLNLAKVSNIFEVEEQEDYDKIKILNNGIIHIKSESSIYWNVSQLTGNSAFIIPFEVNIKGKNVKYNSNFSSEILILKNNGCKFSWYERIFKYRYLISFKNNTMEIQSEK